MRSQHPHRTIRHRDQHGLDCSVLFVESRQNVLTVRGPVLDPNVRDFLVAIDDARLGTIQADDAQVT